MLLSQPVIDSLLNERPSIRLVNGAFNVVTICAVEGDNRFEFSVRVTHPMLRPYAGSGKDGGKLLWFDGCGGVSIDIPAQLKPLTARLRALGHITDEQACSLKDRLVRSSRSPRQRYGETGTLF